MNQINRYAGGGRNVNMGLKTRIIVRISYNVLTKGISQVLPQPRITKLRMVDVDFSRF